MGKFYFYRIEVDCIEIGCELKPIHISKCVKGKIDHTDKLLFHPIINH